MIAKVLVLVGLLAGAQCVNFIIRNNEVGAIWVGTQGNDGKAPLANGGFVLEAFTEVDFKNELIRFKGISF